MRIIRPVWELQLISESAKGLESNASLFLVVLLKVEDYAIMLRRHSTVFVGS